MNLIHVKCPRCSHKLKVPREAAGKTGKCSKCGATIKVQPLKPAPLPELESTPGSEQDLVTAEELDNFLEDHPELESEAFPVSESAFSIPDDFVPLEQEVEIPDYDYPSTSLSFDKKILDIPDRLRSYLYDGEKVLYAERPSSRVLKMQLWVLWSLLFLLFLFTFLLQRLVGGDLTGSIGGFLLSSVIFSIPFAVWSIVIYFIWRYRFHLITDSRTIIAQGIFNQSITIISNRHIQLVSINTGLIDRLLQLDTIELATSARGGGASIFPSFFSVAGCVQLRHVSNVIEILRHYAKYFKY